MVRRTAEQLVLPLQVGSPSVSSLAPDRPVARPLLMSLRPRFAQAILDGTKTVELRRSRVAAPPGTPILLYASTPVRSVLGTATLHNVDTDTPGRLWRRHRTRLGLSLEEFNNYLTGVTTASCLSITHVQPLPVPYGLAWLRDHANFQPPQSYRYLALGDPEPLHTLVYAAALACP